MRPVAVLAGGPSSEHEVSLETAAAMLATFRQAGWPSRPVVIDREGGWRLGAEDAGGSATENAPVMTADRALAALAAQGEVAVLGLHGRFGEDGAAQRLLDAAGVPYTGSGAAASALCMDKELSKIAATQVGAACSRHQVLVGANIPTALLQMKVGLPCVVKPVGGGSSVATSIVRSDDALTDAVHAAQAEDPEGRALVEEFVAGRELTCAVLRQQGRVTCLPLVSIEPRGDAFYDYHAKYETEATRLTCPAIVDASVRAEIERVSESLFVNLELRGVARLDFILDETRNVPVFLEINTLPGMTSHSLVPLAAREAGLADIDLLAALVADIEEDREGPGVGS